MTNGGTPFDLTVIQNNPNAAAEISATIIDNSAGRAQQARAPRRTIAPRSPSPVARIAADLSVGMRITGPGIAPGTVITGINSTNNSVTISSSATTALGAGSGTFEFIQDRVGTTTTGTTTVTGITNTNGLYIGMRVEGTGIRGWHHHHGDRDELEHHAERAHDRERKHEPRRSSRSPAWTSWAQARWC